MPNFLVLGVGKAGTTSLYEYLDQHPDVYMSPVKETNFFVLEGERSNFAGPRADERINSWSMTDLARYRELFEGAARDEKALGEVSPLYLYSEKAPARIKRHVPEAKLVVVLRDPAERAYSAFKHLIQDNREPFEDFSEALRAEPGRIRANWEWIWHYKRLGFYHEQLERYHEAFDPGQIKVYLYEDLSSRPADVMRDLFAFLGVAPDYVPESLERHNASGVPRNKALHRLLTRPSRLKSAIRPLIPHGLRRTAAPRLKERNLSRPKMPEEARRELVEAYREDVLKLQGLIGRDLSAWLRV